MKYLISFSLAFISFLPALQCQDSQNQSEEITLENQDYVDWAKENAFKFISEFKDSASVLDASEVFDLDGNPIPLDITQETFDITAYDFTQIMAPERNLIIKISDSKAIFIHSKRRQEVYFKRYMINLNAKN